MPCNYFVTSRIEKCANSRNTVKVWCHSIGYSRLATAHHMYIAIPEEDQPCRFALQLNRFLNGNQLVNYSIAISDEE